MRVDLLLPTGFSTRPTGGNNYDRHLMAGLSRHGWEVHPHEVATGADVESYLGAGPVVVDSLVVSWAAPVLLSSESPVVPLVHMLFGTPGEHDLLVSSPAVLVTSAWSRRQLVRGGLDPRRIHVAVPGVEPATYSPSTGTHRDLLCVGTVAPVKGHDVLLDALASVADLDWQCTIAGSLDADPDHADSLRKRSAELGLTDRVHLVGELSGPDLSAAYRGAGLLVHPSRSESFGMVVTEALARAVPVIASAVGGIGEAMGNRPGMLVRPNDHLALARALRRWLEDDTLRLWLRRAAAQRLPTLPRWPQTAEVVSHVLEDLA